MGPKKWPKQADFILCRQRNNQYICEELTTQGNLGLGASLVKNLSRVCSHSLLSPKYLSCDEDVSLPPGTRRIPFI